MSELVERAGSLPCRWIRSSMSTHQQALLGMLLLLAAIVLVRLLSGRRYAYGWTARFIASPEFLRTPEWRRIRYDVLRANDGRCELCGRNKHQLPPGEYLSVDHIQSRKARPDLALEITNLAVLCTADNAGKGNRHADDWRHPSHPHRQRS
jgi:hypothetical protein